MKKIITSIVLIFVATFCAVCFYGCKISKKTYIGTWAEIKNEYYDANGTLKGVYSDHDASTPSIRINKDGTIESYNPYDEIWIYECNWMYQKGKLLLGSNIAKIEKGKLVCTLKFEDDNHYEVYTYKKIK